MTADWSFFIDNWDEDIEFFSELSFFQLTYLYSFGLKWRDYIPYIYFASRTPKGDVPSNNDKSEAPNVKFLIKEL